MGKPKNLVILIATALFFYSASTSLLFLFTGAGTSGILPHALFSEAYDFNLTMVHVVDYNSTLNNFVFRSGEPVYIGNSSTNPSQWYFDYDTLVSYFAIVAKRERNLVLPKDFYLFDCSLLYPEIDQDFINVEQAFFQKNPSLGQFFDFPVYGDDLVPTDYSENLMIQMAETYPSWQVGSYPTNLLKIRSMFLQKMDKPVVVLIHCLVGVLLPLSPPPSSLDFPRCLSKINTSQNRTQNGRDRTSEMVGAYEMKYLGWNFTTMYSYEESLKKGKSPIFQDVVNSYRWYCLYLNYTFGNGPYDCLDPLPNSTTTALAATHGRPNAIDLSRAKMQESASFDRDLSIPGRSLRHQPSQESASLNPARPKEISKQSVKNGSKSKSNFN